MAQYEFDWVDAFTTQPFGGNGCAVVYGAVDFPVQDRMRLVRETSLSECAYLVGSDVADFGVRYYLAEREIPMAGHPTIATIASLLNRGVVTLNDGRADFTLEVGSGILPIEVRAADPLPVITMTQPAPTFGDVVVPEVVADLFGLNVADIAAPPQIVSTGSPFTIVLLKDKDSLRRASLDLGKWNALDLPEPFLVTLGGETAEGGTFSRLLMAPPMPAEDPFTGSATGCMAAYLWHHGLIERPRFVAEQGHWMGRPGQAQVEVLGPSDAITGIRVGGQGYVLMSGVLTL